MATEVAAYETIKRIMGMDKAEIDILADFDRRVSSIYFIHENIADLIELIKQLEQAKSTKNTAYAQLKAETQKRIDRLKAILHTRFYSLINSQFFKDDDTRKNNLAFLEDTERASIEAMIFQNRAEMERLQDIPSGAAKMIADQLETMTTIEVDIDNEDEKIIREIEDRITGMRVMFKKLCDTLQDMFYLLDRLSTELKTDSFNIDNYIDRFLHLVENIEYMLKTEQDKIHRVLDLFRSKQKEVRLADNFINVANGRVRSFPAVNLLKSFEPVWEDTLLNQVKVDVSTLSTPEQIGSYRDSLLQINRKGLIMQLPPKVTKYLALDVSAMIQEGGRARTLELEKARAGAIKDSLTGLYNRRGFNEYVRKKVSVYRRDYMQAIAQGRAFMKNMFDLIMMDIDYFKLVNDIYGHKVGDRVLVTVSDGLKRSIRADGEDMLCRFGGEEFLLYIEGDYRDAAERMQQNVIEMSREIMGRINNEIKPGAIDPLKVRKVITLSMGASTITEANYMLADRNKYSDTMILDALIALADKRLYDAKEGGRHCIVNTDFSVRRWDVPEIVGTIYEK